MKQKIQYTTKCGEVHTIEVNPDQEIASVEVVKEKTRFSVVMTKQNPMAAWIHNGDYYIEEDNRGFLEIQDVHGDTVFIINKSAMGVTGVR